MRLTNLLWIALAVSTAARGDFSYTMTSKGGMGAGQATKTSIKGQKMAIETSASTTILDFDAQTVTRINKSQNTYTVSKFSDAAGALAGANISADLKETGQTKNVAGYDAKELVITVDMDMGRGMSGQAEVHMWVASGVPGQEERRAFFKKNAANFPWSAMGAGGNPAMAKTMADLQRKMAALDGVPVMEVIKVKMGGAAAAGPSADQQAKMDQARARLEQMAQQGGPQGDAAKQALARMGAAGGGGGGGMEITMEGSNFSTAGVPDSTFAIPAGFTKSDK
jgi:Domain of unknown function (DUF4412)